MNKEYIDEAEKYLIALRNCETCNSNNTNDCKGCPYDRLGCSAKCYDAIYTAIDIMRRYKKIVEPNDKGRIKINLDKHDLLHTFNSIYLSLETAKDKLNFDKNIKEAILLINECEEKLKKFFEEDIEYD